MIDTSYPEGHRTVTCYHLQHRPAENAAVMNLIPVGSEAMWDNPHIFHTHVPAVVLGGNSVLEDVMQAFMWSGYLSNLAAETRS